MRDSIKKYLFKRVKEAQAQADRLARQATVVEQARQAGLTVDEAAEQLQQLMQETSNPNTTAAAVMTTTETEVTNSGIRINGEGDEINQRNYSGRGTRMRTGDQHPSSSSSRYLFNKPVIAI